MKIRHAIAAALLLALLPLNIAAQSLSERLRSHTGYLCSPSLEGRKAGSEGERLAAEYLYGQLEALGVTMLTGKDGDTFTIVKEDGSKVQSRNIVGILPGDDPALKEEYIVVGAHLDHLGFYSVNVNGVPQRRIYPGACSDASGVAALVECARMLCDDPAQRSRSIIFIGFGAMEEEFAGSRYFACEGGFSSIGNVKMMVNLDMLGREGAFEVYTAMPSGAINSILAAVQEQESVTENPKVHGGVVFPSDNLPFKQAGIPAATLSTGIFREYRTVQDTPDLLSFDNLASQALYASALVKTLCNKASLTGSDQPQGQVYAPGECDTPPLFFKHEVQSFLDSWVYKYLKYPQEDIREGVQGKVVVSFIVEESGEVSNVTVERGVSETLDAEAVKVVGASPKWTPATRGGKKVRTKIVIPVEFRLKRR